jgi:ribose transport system permease protein
MPPFIVTLTTMMFFAGFAIWLTQSRNIDGLPRSFIAIGNGLGGSVAVTFGVAVAAHFALTRTLLGRWWYAVGRNARTALVSGVPVRRTLVAAYVASGFCAAAAAILYTGRLETGSPVLGQRILLDVIGATAIGGTSLFGGKGKVLWTVFGVLFMTLVDNSLNLLGLSNFTVLMVKGGVILAAALLDAARNRYASR